MDNLPEEISQYLSARTYIKNNLAYLVLDGTNRILSMGGAVEHFGLDKLDRRPITEQLPTLSGLLPAQVKPLFIANTQVDANSFIDLHIFEKAGKQWVLFLDTTEAGRKLQLEQQVRLNSDYEKDKNR